MEKELVKAGELDTYITVYQLTRTQDSYGGYSNAKSSLKSMWAKIVPHKGTEKVEDDTVTGTLKIAFLEMGNSLVYSYYRFEQHSLQFANSPSLHQPLLVNMQNAQNPQFP